MRWPGGRLGRIVAAVYLPVWVCLVVGLIWTLIAPAAPGITLFVAGSVVVSALAFGMRSCLPERAGSRLTDFQRAWHRLTLGLELPTALRAISANSDQRNG